MAAIRVFIADDQLLFREAARFAVAQHRDLALAAESDLAGAVAGAVETGPDAAVFGYGKETSREACLEAVAGFREQVPDCPVAVFLELDEEDIGLLAEILALGAAGFISRKCSGTEFVTALRILYYGGALIPRAMLDDIASALFERRLEIERAIRLDEPDEARLRPGRDPKGDEAH